MTPSDLEAQLRDIGARRYHRLHPFHVLLHGGQCTKGQVQAWALNRYYYQAMIPLKDASLIARCNESALRREWRRRLVDHDGESEGDGGIARWLKLTDGLGLDRDYVVSLAGLLPATRFAVEAYVHFVRGAHAAGLYTNLITSAVGITDKTLTALAEAGLDHVQISIQDSDPASADHIAGYEGAFLRKRALAAEVVRHKLPLTVNAVVHRANIDRIGEMVDLALALGAIRIEIAHAQYYGWALKNRAALMPSHDQVERAASAVADLRSRHQGRIVIDAVVPDYYARYPKPCLGGWARRSLNVTPAGKVLPCHAAESITGLEFWNVRQRSLAEIWANSPAFNAFRGTGWMKEPCASCPRRELDFGGCRCQAFALTGDASATDPVCHLAPDHAQVVRLAAVQTDAAYDYRHI